MKKQYLILPGEYWWGGCVNQGYLMPFSQKSTCKFDPDEGQQNDQFAPFFVSSKGRYIWSERPFILRVEAGTIICEGKEEILLKDGYVTLRDAYLAACHAHFPFTNSLPDKRFFTQPQYNTWIELGTEQTTDNILRYAKEILEHDLPAGILMIDEGWQQEYGTFELNKTKIPDPAKLIYELHQMGFSVMLWVTPNVVCAGTQYCQLRDKNYLLRDKNGKVAIREWWTGFSAVLDLSNPDARSRYHGELKRLQKCYGVDGFKFDAGDAYFYRDDDQTQLSLLAREQTAVFNSIGTEYAFNEFRAAWKYGGQPIVSRLHDKYHRWEGFGLDTLIPHTFVQGILGYVYGCPDMVGGGMIDSLKEKEIDEELFVRWAQANAFMSMMQMSLSPWRVLREENSARVIAALKLHAALGEEIYALAKNASITGEPIVRPMEYVFPNFGFEMVKDQFMLGNRYLIAPVLVPHETERRVILPDGFWQGWNGQKYIGGRTINVRVTMDDLPYFTLVV